jgi:hypothetical protein
MCHTIVRIEFAALAVDAAVDATTVILAKWEGCDPASLWLWGRSCGAANTHDSIAQVLQNRRVFSAAHSKARQQHSQMRITQSPIFKILVAGSRAFAQRFRQVRITCQCAYCSMLSQEQPEGRPAISALKHRVKKTR